MLLEGDVIGEPRADEVKDLERRSDGELDGVAPDHRMLHKGAQDRGMLRRAMLGVGRQQDLLLETEVRLLLGLPVGSETCASRR